jgi:anti-anti-sigma regulatory factor/HAMP domain-containing protein
MNLLSRRPRDRIWNHLSFKLIMTSAVFLVLLGAATAYTVQRSLRRLQVAAVERSAVGLEVQGQAALLSVVQQEAQLNAAQFEQAAIATREAAEYMVAMDGVDLALPASALEPQPNGFLADGAPTRRSDVLVKAPLDATRQRQISQSAALDALFPSLLAQYPDGVSGYFVSPEGVLRFYPVVGLGDVVAADFDPTLMPGYLLAAPAQNPARRTIWTPPYLDAVTYGEIVTVSSPIYQGSEFRGVMSVNIDISLTRAVNRLNRLRPTANGYAFLAGPDGRIIAGPANALRDLAGDGGAPGSGPLNSTAITQLPVLEALRTGKISVERLELGGRPVFFAHAPMENIGWSLGVVAPINEVTSQADAVNTAISTGTDDTVRLTLLTLAGFLLLALVGMVLLGRYLTRPIEALVAGTQAVAAGDMNVTIPVKSRDQLGLMADSFNAMIANLRTAREEVDLQQRTLEERVRQRTSDLQHTLEQLQHSTQERQQLSATLQEISSPVVPVFQGVLIMPLIGVITIDRGQLLTSALLAAIEQHRARIVILDVTGVPIIDEQIARVLLDSAQAARMLGAQVVLTGLRPELAETIVSLGLNLAGLIVRADLQSGVAYALQQRAVDGRLINRS